MIPAAFEYVRAASLDEAVRLLGERDDSKLLAGGHSLIPMMKLRLATPARLVDIARLPGLAGIRIEGGRVEVGALTTHAAIAASDEVRRQAPALWDAACRLGDPQVRNRGTIGGACAHADPSADYPAVLLALDASFTVRGKGGDREIAARDFFRGIFETALRSDEILTAIAFTPAPRSAYAKYHHPASHYAVVGAAAALELDGATIRRARVAIAGLGDGALRAGGVEHALSGLGADDAAAIEAACARAGDGVEARSDAFASGAYRRAMAGVYAARAVLRAASIATES
ncbi:MAG: xanthine dehydrogenase family protein subunit M [Candidatus Eremiobacteraeota bacterium]|nr:xanthine dehydrogenase family protein subunit M [Candidatus Eremiobacteraeota bacterium]